MSDVLVRIKRAVLAGRYVFSEKARLEMEVDSITELDVAESILNAVAIYKRLRSRSPFRKGATEYLYVIQSTNLDGLMIYTKGKLVRSGGGDVLFPHLFQEGFLTGAEYHDPDYSLPLLRRGQHQ